MRTIGLIYTKHHQDFDRFLTYNFNFVAKYVCPIDKEMTVSINLRKIDPFVDGDVLIRADADFVNNYPIDAEGFGFMVLERVLCAVENPNNYKTQSDIRE